MNLSVILDEDEYKYGFTTLNGPKSNGVSFDCRVRL